MPKTSCVVPPLRILTLPYPSPDTPRVSVFHLTGASNTQPSHPHTHSFFELLFVEDGEGWRETGRTVLSWIVERRMAEARCLLLETDQSVNQIAQTVGYLDTGHFIRLFRRVNGTTPQAWRLLHRSAP